MLIIGIDPGFSGAIALLNSDTWALEIHDMPILPGSNSKTELNCHMVGTLLSSDEPRSMAVLEKVWAFQGQGISSAFRFGDCYGALRMALIGHGHEFHNPTPNVWKKHFKLGKDKDGSRKLASERFPANADLFSRKKDDGRAEAALLALYGKEKLL